MTSTIYKLLVTGGRDFNDIVVAHAALDPFLTHRDLILIQGLARGADALARAWAIENGVRLIDAPANWDRFRKMAGPIRNRTMLMLEPDMVVAFPGGGGTKDMINIAKEAGVPVYLALEDKYA